MYFLGGAAAHDGDGNALVVYTPASLDKDEGAGIAVDSLSLPTGTFYWKDGTPTTGGGNDLCHFTQSCIQICNSNTYAVLRGLVVRFVCYLLLIWVGLARAPTALRKSGLRSLYTHQAATST